MRKVCGLVMTALFCLTVAVGCSEPPKKDAPKPDAPKAGTEVKKAAEGAAKDVKEAVKDAPKPDAPKEEPKK
jgi:hypothetical protein